MVAAIETEQLTKTYASTRGVVDVDLAAHSRPRMSAGQVGLRLPRHGLDPGGDEGTVDRREREARQLMEEVRVAFERACVPIVSRLAIADRPQ